MAINISTSPTFFRWRPACWLRVHGEDAGSFLQGQFTNELRGLAAAEAGRRGEAVYGLWLSVKGKVVADSFVLRGTGVNEFWIGSYFSTAAAICARLEGHIIADDVSIEDVTAGWAGISLMGEVAESMIETSGGGAGFGFPGRRDRRKNVEWIFPVAGGEPAWVAHLASVSGEIDAESVERRRIVSGVPAIPQDIGPGDLPNEGGLEVDAISYTKGCYLGQEVMARLKSMGQVRRRLLRVTGAGGSWPSLPAAVFSSSRQVGELRSAVGDGEGGWLGLAMLSLMHLTPEAPLAFAPDAPAALRLVDTP